jgi:ubiquinone/menaquinone biosynthesis C-methylase UbiE
MALLPRLYAALYDRLSAGADAKIAPLRERTAGRAHGAVLEIGGGTGANLAFYPHDARLSVVEPNPHMAARLRAKAERHGLRVQIEPRGGEELPYADATFDAVVSTLVLCSVTDQARVLAEVRRVLRAGGTFHFLEHVASDNPRTLRWQQRLNPIWRRLADGCTLDRDTASAIRAAGFGSVEIEEAQYPGSPSVTRRLIVGCAVV